MEEEKQPHLREEDNRLTTENDDDDKRKKKQRRYACGWLRDRKIRDLVQDKRRLVEVPCTANLAATVNALIANKIMAAPIAAPPGRYIGAGGSMILESDRATGAVRKHYIGIVTMLDVLVHIAEGDPNAAGVGVVDLEMKMAVPVSSVIGHSLEGLSLWTLNPNTSILDCMETFSKGVHRALVPLERQTEADIAVEIVEASPGYRMLTQMDVLIFLRANGNEMKDIMSCSVAELEAVNENVFAVTKNTRVIEAIRAMRTFALGAVPVISADEDEDYGDEQLLQDGRGRRLIDTFSATDLRGCSVAQLQSMLNVSVVEFKERVSTIAAATACAFLDTSRQKLITCYHETELSEVIDEAVMAHVHRVWVVDRQGLLRGLVSLTDMLRVIRKKAMATEELQEVADTEPTI